MSSGRDLRQGEAETCSGKSGAEQDLEFCRRCGRPERLSARWKKRSRLPDRGYGHGRRYMQEGGTAFHNKNQNDLETAGTLGGLGNKETETTRNSTRHGRGSTRYSRRSQP